MAHEYEKLIKCPYCNYEDQDSWEFTEDEETQVTCGRCEKDFNVSRQIEVTYSTSKIDCEVNHNFLVDSRHIFKKKFNKGEWTPLPEENWEYVEIKKCTNCDHTKYDKLSKETYLAGAVAKPVSVDFYCVNDTCKEQCEWCLNQANR